MGGHTEYTKEIGDEIADRISAGEPLAQICHDDHMPAVRTVSAWRAKNPDFHAAIARAREVGYDAIAERLRMTARGIIPEDGGDSTHDVARDKLIIETDLKLLAKWHPTRYGDRTTLNHEGEVAVAVTNVTTKDRAKAMALLIARQQQAKDREGG